ncbi:MAG: hypothetical protein ACNS62_18770 [Candidatus Cyclobacteriaceae bacterium M3_2C_046]
MKTSGYSGTPLVKKIGLKPGHALLLHHQPEHYFDLLEKLPEGFQLKKMQDPQ